MRRSVLATLLVSIPAAAQEFTATKIPAFITPAHASALNESGHVAGEAGSLQTQAYRFASSIVENLGSPGGFISITGIDANDRVLGWSRVSNRPFLYTGLIAAVVTSPSYIGAGLNDPGQIAGTCSPLVACIGLNGFTTTIGTLGGELSNALAINRFGEVTGEADLPKTLLEPVAYWHAFLYESGHMFDLGTLVGRNGYSEGAAISAAGDVVGWSDTFSGSRHAFRWSGGVMTDLGTLGGAQSSALGMNAAGDIVGTSDSASGPRAFIYRSGAMVDLNSLVALPGVSLTTAHAINSAGQIAADGSDGFPYLLTPRQLRRFAYALVNRPSTVDYVPDPAYAYNASGGPIHVHRVGVGNYNVTFDDLPGWGPSLSSAFAVSTAGDSTVMCSVPTYSSSTSGIAASVSCIDTLTRLPAEASFTILIVGNGSLPTPSAFVMSGGPAPVPPPSPLTSWTTGRLPPSVTHNAAAGEYSVLLGTGNTAQSAKIVTASGGAARCNNAGGISGGLDVACYDLNGNSVDHGFSVLQVAGGRTGRRVGFAFADQQGLSHYVVGSASSFNSSGGQILVDHGLVGRYSVTFMGLQKQPGHSETVQVTGFGSVLRTCQIFAWSNNGDGTGLQAAVECRDVHGNLVDSRFSVLVIE